MIAAMGTDAALVAEQATVFMAFRWVKLMLRALELKKRRVKWAALGHWLNDVKKRGREAVQGL